MKFNNIEISLGAGCPLHCVYCPQKLFLSRYGIGSDKMMPFSTFIRCLDNVIVGGSIIFCGFSEPFVNKNCSMMIKYAYEHGFKVSLNTTLVGMTENDLEIIKDIHFDFLHLHIPDQDSNAKFIIDNEYLRIFEKFTSIMQISAYSCHGQVHHEIKNKINAKIPMYTNLNNRAGNLSISNLPSFNPKGKIVCLVGNLVETTGVWAPLVLPDGRMVLCCHDYGMKHVLGNLLHQSADEIINGEEYQKILKGMDDDSIDLLCRKCGTARKEKDMPYYKMNLYLNGENINISEEKKAVLEKFKSAKNICIYGLGKFFRDRYFPLGWDKAIRANLFCDGNLEKLDWENVNVIKPEQLLEYEDLLVITHVKEPKSLNMQLEKLGIYNYINICDIYGCF